MKKTRTIQMRDGSVYYHSACVGTPTHFLREQFNLPASGKARITIKNKGPYKFVRHANYSLYKIYKSSYYISVVCCEQFDQLFFRPDGRKRYDIIVKAL